MNKVIIRTREDVLTHQMHQFGNSCVNSFIKSIELETYGTDWCECSYSNAASTLSCWVKLSNSGTISACVFTK